MKNRIEEDVLSLLKEWCDALIQLQVSGTGSAALDGAILCPACKTIHGRCHDAVYPFLCLADITGEEKYRKAAIALFKWGENMLNDDGSLNGGGQSNWHGITVFNVIALYDAITKHGRLMDELLFHQFETRMRLMAEWVYKWLVPGTPTNINYYASGATALELAGQYFQRNDYIKRAEELVHICIQHISKEGLLYGEGGNSDGITPKGCRAIDIGYNVEESLPALLRYAKARSDMLIWTKIKECFRVHLDFMLPDGAWDNSFGTRNYKWTYWGSRTSDGCQDALFELGKEEAVFAEAAYRNLCLYKQCTFGGLLAGGRDYGKRGELPCVHHSFCHAKSLALAIDNGISEFNHCKLPIENKEGVQYYQDIASYRVKRSGWIADICGYDYEYVRGGHTSGGMMSLLWHKKTGIIVAGGMVDYSLKEPGNMQLSRNLAIHKSLCPVVEARVFGKIMGPQYDMNSVMECWREEGVDCVEATSYMISSDYECPDGYDYTCIMDYAFTDDKVVIYNKTTKVLRQETVFRLPIISDKVLIKIVRGDLISQEKIFNLVPGFEATLYCIHPNNNGEIGIELMVEEQ